uniref:Cyclic nucleotide-binding domain-containing protein n=2 Tax=Rhizochromulina marina TaxID=1034831 RepID=A0A7S2SDF2_9STRA
MVSRAQPWLWVRFSPRSPVRLCWDFFVVLPLLAYVSIVLPFRLCFVDSPRTNSTEFWVDFAVDMIFLSDVLLNFCTGVMVMESYSGEAAVVEYDPCRVAGNYLSTWFLVDFVSAIPFEVMSSNSEVGILNGLKVLKTGRVVKSLKLVRALKLLRAPQLLSVKNALKHVCTTAVLDRLQNVSENSTVRLMVSLLCILIPMGFLIHILSCIWVYIGRRGFRNDQENWMETAGFESFKDTEEGFPQRQIYVTAFYFCVTTITSVGYGDILPLNTGETAFVIFLEAIGGFMWAMIIASLSSLMASFDVNSRLSSEKLDSLNAYMAVRMFPKSLRTKMRNYFRFRYSTTSAADETEILDGLSDTLKSKVAEHLCKDLFFGDLIFKKEISEPQQAAILPLLKPVRFDKFEVLCREGEYCNHLFVVISGTAELSNSKDQKHSLSHHMSIGDIELVDIGEKNKEGFILAHSKDLINAIQFLKLWPTCLHRVTALEEMECYSLSGDDFCTLFDQAAILRMQQTAITPWKMVEDHLAPTLFGRPERLLTEEELSSRLHHIHSATHARRDRLSDVVFDADRVAS